MPRRTPLRLRAEQLEDRLNPAGGLDPTFSGDGRLAIDIGPNPGTISSNASVLQPDGKLVSVGSGPGGNFHLMRLNSDGTLDPTFSNGAQDLTWDGGDGMTLIAPNGLGGNALADVALQPDGKIVAVGGGYVVRLTPSGQRDTSFGTNGLLTLPTIGTSGFAGTAVTVQSDGKIVLAGYANFPVGSVTNYDFVAIRLNADGTLDATFDGDGIRSVAVTAAPATGDDRADAVAIDANGKIVLAGYATPTTTGQDMAVVRLNPDGSSDGSFSGDGIATLTFHPGPGFERAAGVVLQPDGKIVLGGASRPSGSFQPTSFAAARLNADGSPDTTFSGDGFHAVPGTASVEALGASSVALLPDGRIVLAGSPPGAGALQYLDFGVAVLTPAGANDVSFSGDGVLIFEPFDNGGGNAVRATGVAVTAAGKILVSGRTAQGPASFALLNTDGTFDSAYGTGGIANHFFRVLGLDSGNATALQPDGKIVVGGNSHFTFATNATFALARVNPDGTLDPTFGGDGVLTTGVAGTSTVYALAVQPDGKIVAAGGSNQSAVSLDTTAAVARYNPNGTLDTSFGTGGILNLNLGTTGDVFNAVVVQPDGKIVLGGSIRTGGGTNYDFAVVRLNTDGSYDTSFGVGGLVRLALGNTDRVASILLQPDGKIVAAGDSDSRGAVVRLNADGSLDTAFDADGIVHFGGTGLNQMRGFNDVAIQSDGKLVFVGSTLASGATSAQMGVARLNANGSVDTSFSGDGVAPVVFNGSIGLTGDAIAVTWDGRILAGGTFGANDYAVARLLSDGGLDPSFDTDGKVTVDMVGAPYGYVDATTQDFLSDLLVQPDGNIVLAGSIGTNPGGAGTGGSDFGLARLDGGGVPPIDIRLSNGLIAENAGANALVGTLTTTDPNTLDTFTYSLVAGAGDTNNTQFQIVGDKLQAVASFDYETLPHTRTVRVRTTDQNGFSYEEAFEIIVTNVNEAPAANPDSYSVGEDGTLTVLPAGVLGNDSDPEGDLLSAVLVSGPAHGSLTFNADGSFSYVPFANFNGTDSFTYRATDGALSSPAATVTITVTPANDPPTATVGLNTHAPTPTGTLVATATKSDLDGDPLSLRFEWRVNGVLRRTFQSATALTDSFPVAGNAVAGDTITVTVTPNDGTTNGLAATDSATVIAVAADVSDKVSVWRSGFSVNRRTGIWAQDLVITNTSNQTLTGGFAVRLENLTSGVTLTAAGIVVGSTTYTLSIDTSGPNGPRIVVPVSLMAQLRPGESLRLKLQFTNPAGAFIDFFARTFSDPTL